jgi:hypothetical protein
MLIAVTSATSYVLCKETSDAPPDAIAVIESPEHLATLMSVRQMDAVSASVILGEGDPDDFVRSVDAEQASRRMWLLLVGNHDQVGSIRYIRPRTKLGGFKFPDRKLIEFLELGKVEKRAYRKLATQGKVVLDAISVSAARGRPILTRDEVLRLVMAADTLVTKQTIARVVDYYITVLLTKKMLVRVPAILQAIRAATMPTKE